MEVAPPNAHWKDAVALNNRTTNLDIPVVVVAAIVALETVDVRGKAVAMEVPAIQTPPEAQYTLRADFQRAISAEVAPAPLRSIDPARGGGIPSPGCASKCSPPSRPLGPDVPP